MAKKQLHLSEELAQTGKRISVTTRHGKVTGGRALNRAAVFLELPYGLPPVRFEDPKPLPVTGYRYPNKEYIHESLYATQPTNDGQAGNSDPKDKVGLGEPTENPLFLNIVVPSSFPSKRGFPVNVYIHGGFLQFGSPHGLSGQAQFIAEEKEEIFVNPGYRLSAFGFIASNQPDIPGNYGFKDQWLALEWIRDNISAFGGNPNDIRLSGLSAGAHSVHQLLHHVTRLPPGINSPFQRACLQSNAVATNPKTPKELREQYQVLLRAVGLDPLDKSSHEKLKDSDQISWQRLTKEIELINEYGTFRGASDDGFLPLREMERQADGTFAKLLKEKGVRSIVVGDLTEEWYLYSIAHPITKPEDVVPNLKRYYPDDIVDRLLKAYKPLSSNSTPEECAKLYGRILSDGQVHLPIRILHRNLKKQGFPIVRYEIRWTPPQLRPKGYVTHGTDRSLWAYRKPVLSSEQLTIARNWLSAVDSAMREAEGVGISRAVDDILTLKEDGSIGWTKDGKWKQMEQLAEVLEKDKKLKARL
ncbi:hypothetical protein M422DRAFT_74458 [Sphaerobolus stellatus SS14]|nr:hypothetical protein M422DRAFT_74458 [Sphaerobolus stellatus SS14]